MSLPTQYNGKNQSPVGALSGTLARLQANRPLRELREIAKGVTKQLPDAIQARAPRKHTCLLAGVTRHHQAAAQRDPGAHALKRQGFRLGSWS